MTALAATLLPALCMNFALLFHKNSDLSMNRSLSKLLHETQAAAAKKLGVLENTFLEDYPTVDGLTEHLQVLQLSSPYREEGANVPPPSKALPTGRLKLRSKPAFAPLLSSHLPDLVRRTNPQNPAECLPLVGH